MLSVSSIPSDASCSLEKRRPFPLAPPSPDELSGRYPMTGPALDEGMWKWRRHTVHPGGSHSEESETRVGGAQPRGQAPPPVMSQSLSPALSSISLKKRSALL